MFVPLPATASQTRLLYRMIMFGIACTSRYGCSAVLCCGCAEHCAIGRFWLGLHVTSRRRVLCSSLCSRCYGQLSVIDRPRHLERGLGGKWNKTGSTSGCYIVVVEGHPQSAGHGAHSATYEVELRGAKPPRLLPPTHHSVRPPIVYVPGRYLLHTPGLHQKNPQKTAASFARQIFATNRKTTVPSMPCVLFVVRRRAAEWWDQASGSAYYTRRHTSMMSPNKQTK